MCVPTAQAGRVEDYYYKLAGTWPFTTYSSQLEQKLQELRKKVQHSVSPTDIQRTGIPISGEVGIYWPITVSERYLLVGINCTLFRDLYRWQEQISDTESEEQEEAVFFGSFSGSLQYYPISLIGSGPFVRFDAGLSMGNIYERSGKIERPGETWTGLGLLGGIGYAIPVFTGTHLTVEAWYAVRDVEKYAASTWHFGIGAMW